MQVNSGLWVEPVGVVCNAILVSPLLDAFSYGVGDVTVETCSVVEKQFKNGISIFFKANNLLDAKRERYLKTVNKSNLEYEEMEKLKVKK